MAIRLTTLFVLCCTAMSSHAQDFYTGVDLSYVNELEDCEASYQDRSGATLDPYTIFENEGANIVRLRLWHDPQWTNYSNLEDVKVSIGRAKAVGMEVLLDFHYSDFWADPGRQWRPDAWKDIVDDNILGDSVYNYTYNTLSELNDEGLLPDMVQIGNETNGNILIKKENEELDDKSPNLFPIDWDRQSVLFNKGLKAVSDIELLLNTQIKTVIHIADPTSARFWFDQAHQNGLDSYDIIGLSYYPEYHKLLIREAIDMMNELKSTFNKEVLIVETAFPWTTEFQDQSPNLMGQGSKLSIYDFDISLENQRDFMIELSWLVKENGGLGVIYWEPAWLSTSCQTYWNTGSNWENATLFDFEGQLHMGADFLSYDYSQKPEALEDQQVTFKVDMTNIDTENDVFVTGDFTGEQWTLQPMSLTQNNIYQFEVSIPGRSTGAYIFYNNDSWSDQYRESVPGVCAKVNETHREYQVQGQSANFHFSWGRCDRQPNDVILDLDENRTGLSMYPTIAEDRISIVGGTTILNLELLDVSGKRFSLIAIGPNDYRVDHLTNGLYLIKATVPSGIHVLRFIKE